MNQLPLEGFQQAIRATHDAEAVRWYRKAAEQGNADAMRALARGMLEDAMKAKPKGAK